MKTIYEHDLGSEGGKAGAYLDGGMVEVKVGYPVAKIVEPIMAQLDPLKEKLKAALPMDAVTDPLVDKIFEEAKEAIVKLISE